MGKSTESRLNADLRSGKLERAYFLYGEEKFLVQTYTDKIAGIVPEDAREMNLARWRISVKDDVPKASELEDFLMSVPFFAEYKCAIIEDLDADWLDNTEHKAYLELIGNIPETSVLVFSMRNLAIDAKKPKAKLKKLLEVCENVGVLVDFNLLPQSKVMAMAIRKAQGLGCELSADNAALLANECANSLTMMQNEIVKLCAYRQSGEITREDISKLVPKRIDSDIYSLAKELFAGRTAAALEILGNLFLQQTEPTPIMAALSSYFVDLYRAKLGQMCRKSAQATAAEFNYPPNRAFVMKYAFSDASGLSERYLARCIAILYQQNKLLNSSGEDKRLIIERAVVEIAALEKQ